MSKTEVIVDEFLSDISTPRNRKQLRRYYDAIMRKVEVDTNLTKLARLRKGLFKEFFEELSPLLVFSESTYCNDNSLFYIVVGNQHYDAIIKTDSFEKKVEFSKYENGHLNNQFAKQLNEHGVTDVIFRDVDEDMNEYLVQFQRCVKKKANNCYIDTDIIFIIDIGEVYRFIYDFNIDNFKNNLKEILMEVNFKGNRVYLM